MQRQGSIGPPGMQSHMNIPKPVGPGGMYGGPIGGGPQAIVSDIGNFGGPGGFGVGAGAGERPQSGGGDS